MQLSTKGREVGFKSFYNWQTPATLWYFHQEKWVQTRVVVGEGAFAAHVTNNTTAQLNLKLFKL